MGLMTVGYWPPTYWAEDFWHDGYWNDYGEVIYTFMGLTLSNEHVLDLTAFNGHALTLTLNQEEN